MRKDIGVHGNMFGGFMLEMLDEAGASFCARICGTPHMVTLKFGETLFKKPVKEGMLLQVYGEVVKIGTSSIKVKLEVRRTILQNMSEIIVCETEVTFVRIEPISHEPIPISKTVREKYQVQNSEQ